MERSARVHGFNGLQAAANSRDNMTRGREGGGLGFNGSTFILTPLTESANLSHDITVTYWMRQTTNSVFPQQIPICKIASYYQPGPGWLSWLESAWMRMAVSYAHIFNEINDQNIVTDRRWHLIVWTMGANPNIVQQYNDGELQVNGVESTGTIPTCANTAAVCFGTTQTRDYTPFYNGSLADARIYTNHVFTAQEAALLFRWRGQLELESLTLQTNGLGSVSLVDNGKPLAIGSNYTLTALPAKNWLFSNWTASGSETFVSNNPVLKFTMQPNLLLTANFVTNPFPAVQGAYHGLFYQTNPGVPVTEQSTGFATITIAPAGKGAYSAVLKVDGGSYSFSGMFDLNGNSEATVKRTGKSPLALALHMDLNLDPPADSMTGTVGATNWDGPSSLVADRAWFNGTTIKATNDAGKYTFALPGAPGCSVGEFNNYLTGNAVLTGTLADGATITSVSTPISREGYVPIYYSYLPGTNLLFGWLNFTNNPPQTVQGTLTWFKLPAASRLYPGGFTNQTNIIGSFYAPVTTNTLVTNGTLTIADPGQGISLVYSNVSIISNKLTRATPPTNQLIVSIIPTTGAMTLTFRPTGSKADLTAHGVVLQNSPANVSIKAAGWFPGTNQTGYFLLSN